MEQQYLPFARQYKRSFKYDEQMFRVRLSPAFGHLRLNQITRHQVQAFHAELRESGLAPATADHHLKLMRRALNLACDWGLLSVNPAAKVRQFNADNQVEHYLSDQEMANLVKTLKEDNNRATARVFLFLLGTGQRLNCALQATWSQFDLSKNIWTIPKTKSGKRHSVPLTKVALDVLGEIPQGKPSDHVFISSRTGKSLGHVSKVWQRIRVKAGFPHLRIHDLRHQFASLMINSGRTLYEVQQLLGHASPQVSQRYSHLSKATLEDAANSASDKITRAMESSR